MWRDHPMAAYRALASKALEGKPVGPFRYYGTRPDDPNDIFPHEHRRELRGLLVFCAWLNHDDSRSINSLDTLVNAGSGRTIVRHHLLDFGSTLGSGTTQAQSPRAGNEFLWESRPTIITMLTLGLYVRPWIKVPYPDIPALGRIESSYFTPEDWKPEYPNSAFANARPEDRFWAARILAGISDDGVRAVVDTARYTDSKATGYLVETLITRKNKVLEELVECDQPAREPVAQPDRRTDVRERRAQSRRRAAAERYTIQWSSFDNASNTHKDVGAEQTVTSPAAQAPAALLSAPPEYISALVRAFHGEHAAWSRPLMVYFRRTGDNWSLVGLERN